MRFGADFMRITEFFLPLEHMPHPPDTPITRNWHTGSALLVLPVGRNPLFGNAMHLLSAYLHLHPLPIRPNDRSMQGLVHIRLRHGDIVFKASRDRFPCFVDNSQTRVAISYVVDNYAKRYEIVNLINVNLLALYLAVH